MSRRMTFSSGESASTSSISSDRQLWSCQGPRVWKNGVSVWQLKICPVRLGHGIAFARALITGLAAQEFEPAGRAAQEIELLHTFISGRAHVHTINRSLFKCAMTLQML